MILNPEGRILYCLPETAEAVTRSDYWFGPMNYHYMRLPYSSGTVVETISSPFFPSVKGVVVSRAEPWEGEFLKEDEQWLLYPADLYRRQSGGIGVTPLNNYTSILFGGEFVLPFIQFLKRKEGTFSESERWLKDLGALIRRDKSCLAMILKDGQPGVRSGVNEDRQRYVEELWERCGIL